MSYERRRIYTGLIIFLVFFLLTAMFMFFTGILSLPNLTYAMIGAVMMYFMWYMIYPYVVRRYSYEDIK